MASRYIESNKIMEPRDGGGHPSNEDGRGEVQEIIQVGIRRMFSTGS